MRSRGFAPASLAFLSLLASARAAFLLDFFTGENCYSNGCLRSLSSALPTASSDCSAFHASPSPTDLPAYATPCWNTHRYSSACSCIGVTPTPSGTTTTTTTVPFARPTVNDGNLLVPKDARGKLDATLNLDVICQSKVKDAVEAAATQAGLAGSVVTVTQTKTTTSVSTTTSVWTTTKVTFSGLMSCAGTTVTATVSGGGGGVGVNAAAAAATTTPTAAVASTSVPTGCMRDAEATAIVDAFKKMLSDQDKGAVKKVAEGLLADEFMGMSTGVNSLSGEDTSNMTLPNAASFLSFLATAALIPEMTTLDVFHDCNRIAWYWAAKLSGGKEERGVSLIYTIEGAMADLSDGVVDAVESVGNILGTAADAYGGRKVNMLMWEFDSLGWSETN